jgi:hypothetical protein
MSFGGYTILFFLAAIFVVLLAGIVLMMRGGDVNKKYGNKLMVARVSLQFIVLILLGIMFMIGMKS